MMNKLTLILGAVLIMGTLVYLNTADLDNHTLSDTQFLQFETKYERRYSSPHERAYRKQVFLQNWKIIEAHNQLKDKTFTVKVNDFADLTLTELKKFYSSSFNSDAKLAEKCPLSEVSGETADSINWAEKGKVFAVKDQKRCGSCWAFSATAALESAVSIKTNQPPVDISEQELVSCSGDYGNKGCGGGYMHFAYNYILEHKINLGKDYPYKGRNSKCDKSKSGKGPITMTSCVRQVPNVDGLVSALNVGPVAVGLFADVLMYFYDEGIFNVLPKFCDFEVDHGVLAVGYVKNHDIPHFIVKNSWGKGWGEKGYFRIAMGTDKGLCRLSGSGYNYYPVV